MARKSRVTPERAPSRWIAVLLVASYVSILASPCLAQPPPSFQPPASGTGGTGSTTIGTQQQPGGTPASPQTGSGTQGSGNLFDNLWGMVGTTLDNVAEATEGTDQAQTVENLDIIFDTAGVVGQDIVNYDPENAQSDDLLNGVVGFFENVAQNSDKIYDTTNVALESLTSDERVQTRVTDWATEQLTDVLDVDTVTHSAGQGGACEVEWGANYVGTVLNNGRETLANTEGECCDLCAATPGCNTFVYCGQVLGCGETFFEFGQCYLKQQENPSLKQAYERGVSVYWTSGVLRSPSQSTQPSTQPQTFNRGAAVGAFNGPPTGIGPPVVNQPGSEQAIPASLTDAAPPTLAATAASIAVAVAALMAMII